MSEDGNEADSSYLTTLDKRLSTLAREAGATIESVIRGAQGAFPALVVQRLQALGLDRNLPHEPETNQASRSSIGGPELHPLDFEWYFTEKSADDLAHILTCRIGEILCLSSPTVAVALARRGYAAVLVDRNPLIRARLAINDTSLQFTLFDLVNPLPLRCSFPVIFFDAPWYPDFTSLWLWQASQLTRAGGLVAFALFPRLLRPEAEQERAQILEQASHLGQVELLEGALSYETPLFEREALAACGIKITADWRSGDLVLVRVKKIPEASPPIIQNWAEKWDSFLLGRQVVKLRRLNRGAGAVIIAPLEDCPNYVFPSVSMRDSRRDQIDLWTSRNRVARAGRRDIVSRILSDLAAGCSLSEIVESHKLLSRTLQPPKELISTLLLVLGPPASW